MELALALVLFAVVAAVVVLPLLRRRAPATADEGTRAELEAAKEAKYREIRDAELDYRMGKFSDADWRELDAELRAEAIEILKELDQLDARRR